MAEEFRLNEVFWDGCAINGHERALGAQGVLGNATGDEFLPRPAFASDEDRRVAGSDLADRLEDFLHWLGTADDAFLIIGWVDERASGFAGGGQVATGAECAVDQCDELSLIEGLHDVVVGTELHRLDRGLGRAECGHENHHRLRLRATEHLQSLDASDPAHAVVEEDDIWLLALGEGDAGFATVGFNHRVPLASEGSLKRVAQVLVVIDDENFVGNG